MARTPDAKCGRLDHQLAQYAEMARLIRKPGLAYSCMEEMVLKRGRVFRPALLPAKYERGKMGVCYYNAYRLANHSGGLTYAEGFATRPGIPIAVRHAWCYRRGGWVVDPTWPDSEDCEYRGIPIDKLDLFKRILQTRQAGVLVVEPRILQYEDPIRGLREIIDARIGAVA